MGLRVWVKVFEHEEDCLRPACHSKPLTYLQAVCHNNPSMVSKISNSSTKKYVEIRKSFFEAPQCGTVLMHTSAKEYGHPVQSPGGRI